MSSNRRSIILESLISAIKSLAIYDGITILYVFIGIGGFVWVSTGNSYIFNLIEKRLTADPTLDQRVQKCDLYYIEIRKS